MFYRKISAQVIFILSSLLYLQGCSDDSISPESYVTGWVTSSLSTPIPGLKVKIGNETAYTDRNGNFRLKNNNFPYDILVIDEAAKSQLLIKSISMPRIIIPDFMTPNITEEFCYFKVNLPKGFIQSGKKGKLIFTNGYGINSSCDILTDSVTLKINMNGYDISRGKTVIITYQTDASGNITSYENYYENSELAAITDYTEHLVLEASQLAYNPGEKVLYGNINTPPGYNSSEQYFYLNFSTYNNSFNDPGTKFANLSGNNFGLIVPDDLPSDFSVMINNYINTPGGDKYSLETFKLDKNTNNVVLNAKLPPDLISPENNSVSVNSQTEFSHTAGEGSGISIVRFFKEDQIYSIVTASPSFSFSELNNFETGDISNSLFVWTVQKYGVVNDIEQYLTWFSKKGEFISKGEQRNFQTAP